MSDDYLSWDGRHHVDEAEPEPTEPLSEVDELGDPFADDLSEQLAAKAPHRYTNRFTAIFAGAVLLAGGFLGGVQVEKHFGAHSTATPAVFPSGFRNAGGFGGGGNGGGTTGTVKLVDGSTVYVTTANGDVVIVHTTGNTTVTTAGSVKDLTVGSTVTVTGQTGSDGSVTASRIVKSAG
jgi:hypothetical protein